MINLLKEIDEGAANTLKDFLQTMIRIARLKPALKPTLLEAYEIRELMDILVRINCDELREKIRRAVEKMTISPLKHQKALKKLATVAWDLTHYYRSLEFSLPTGQRHPLNYTYAFSKKILEKREKAQYQLSIKAYHVAPIIQRILSPLTIAYSATIGDADVFGCETGIKAPFYSFPSDFPVENTKIFLPIDTPNLAVKARSHREPAKILGKIAKACKEFAQADLRSLVVVISERERQKFLDRCQEFGIEAISYGNGRTPKDVAKEFKEGKGRVLVGTVANYGEGLDLPQKLASVIFFLRPSYPPPDDPGTVFEARRFGRKRWALWNWRVMIESLQVRGRNIRSSEDLGVTIFISQQFRRFLLATLPGWLQDAYEGKMSFEEAIEETIKLTGKAR